MIQRYLMLAICFVLLIASVAEAKEKLVLLPMDGPGWSQADRKMFQNAIKSAWSKKYKIFSGAEVEAKLKKFAISSCTTDECLEKIAIAFNGHLVGRGYLSGSKETPLLGLEIRDIFTNEDKFSESRGCKGCDGAGVIEMFRSMALGRTAGSGSVSFVGASAAGGPSEASVVRVTPKVSGNRGSKIAALFFDSNPSGATVYLGDTVAGITPYQNLGLKPGQTISVTLKKEGFHNQTVRLTLSGGTNELDTFRLKSRYGTLSIESDPQGADVILAGKSVGKTPYTQKMLAGAYLVSLRKDLYLPAENQRVVVTEEKTTRKEFSLSVNFGSLSLRPEPSGADYVLKNSQRKIVHQGTTPETIKAEAGDYTLTFSESGYADLIFNLTVAREKTIQIGKAQATLRRLQGEVIISSEPFVKGASVIIDGENAGALPFMTTLDEGPHKIEVKGDGHVGVQKIFLKDGETQAVKVSVKKGFAGGDRITNSLGMTFVYIKPGTFHMGSPSSEPERGRNEARHKVTLTKGFYMQTTEVTQGQWKAVMGKNPSEFKSCGDNCPVEKVSWEDVQRFIEKLNAREDGAKYRLPTEAQWEYAARAGTTTPFAFGDCLATNEDNYNGNYPMPGCSKGRYRKKTTPVASFKSNAWGLYNMHGNVSEWCEDWYGTYPDGSATDPVGPSSGKYRVLRGGSWKDFTRFCRSAHRGMCTPSRRSIFYGFRLLRGLE